MPQRAGRVVIVTPSLADANNGNWRTSERWRRFLAPRRPARLATAWPDAMAAADSVMIALHARRSAAAIAAWHARHGSARLAVVLTGTDLYRDIAADAAALIIDKAKSDVVARTPHSLHILDDFLLAAQVEVKLAQEGHNVGVDAHKGQITLTINKNVLMLSRLEEELKSIVEKVPGVATVTTRIGARAKIPAKLWIRRTAWVNLLSKVSARPRRRMQRSARVAWRR